MENIESESLNLELAKKIYKEIYSSICDLNEKYNIFCSLPAFIELNGVIYQAPQCLEQEWFDHTKLGAGQMQRVMEGKAKFYFKENENDSTD